MLKQFFVGLVMMALLVPGMNVQAATVGLATTTDENIRNVIRIICGNYGLEDEFVPIASGSGVILDDGLVLTNAHVITSFEDEESYYFYDECFGGVTSQAYETPIFDIALMPDTDFYRNDAYFDYVLLDAYDENDLAYDFSSTTTYGNPDSLVHGDEMVLIGYPDVAGATITTTYGYVSGFEGTNWIKTDAAAEFGNSGGGAFDVNGNLIGLVTSVASGALNSYTYVQNLNAVIEDMFGADFMVRDYETLYTAENRACLDGDCYQFGEGVDDADLSEELEPVQAAPEEFVEAPTSVYDERFRDDTLIARLAGRILLQVEQRGEAWYVHPELKKRFYMKDGPAAYQMMRLFSLGITDADLAKIGSVASSEEMLATTSACGTNPLANRLKGRILLQVEQHGEAWYIHPDTCKRIYLKDGEAAYAVMRLLSLGITDNDLKRLPSDQL